MQAVVGHATQIERYRRGKVEGKSLGSGSLSCDAEAFHEVLQRESQRSLRSGTPLLLVLIDVSGYGPGEKLTITAQRIQTILSFSTREVDTKGWYAQDAVLGILFTEFGSMRGSIGAAREAIVARLYNSLSRVLKDGALRIVPCILQTSLLPLNAFC